MFKKKTVLAIVIARGGSKGIKLKNLRKINNKTLIWHVGTIIKKIKYLDKAIISTDHYKIAKEATKAGIEVPFLRPKIFKLWDDVEGFDLHYRRVGKAGVILE